MPCIWATWRPSYPLPPEQARYRLFLAVGDFLIAIAAVAPLLLVLDDLHWADQASLDLLAHLAGQLSESAILIIGAYRTGEVEQHTAFQAFLAELARRRVLVTLNLGPLGQEEITVLVTGTLDTLPAPSLISWLYQYSEGNPFFAEELLRYGMESGRIVRRGQQWILVDPGWPASLPPGISGAINQRLARLPEAVVSTLKVGAVTGRRIDLSLLAVVLGQTEMALAQQLQTAVQAHLLRSDVHGGYTFHHDITRACLLDQLTFVERQQLHRQIGHALLNRPLGQEQLAALAYHFAHSGDRERGATYVLEAAAHAVAAFAFEDALAHYRTADSLLTADDPRRGLMWLAWGEAACMAGASREAAAAFTAAQDWFRRAGDLTAAAQAAHGRGRAWWQLEAIAEAQAAFEEALDLLAGAPSPERVKVLVDLANLLTLSRLQYHQGRLYSQEALDLASRLDDRRLLTMVKRTMGTLLVRSDDLARGLALLEEALTLALACDDPAEAAECCGFLVVAYVWAARIQDADRAARQMIAFASQAHMVYPLRHIYVILAVLAGLRGRLAEANDWLAQAETVAARLDNPEVLAYLDFGRGTLALIQGDYPLAEQAFARLIARLRQASPGGVTWFLGLLGLAQALQGKETKARACLAEMEVLLAGLPEGATATLVPLSQMTQIALALADRDLLVRLQPRLLRFRGHYNDGLMDRHLGAMAILQKDWAAAERFLNDAEATARREGLVFELAHILSSHADLALARGQPEAARAFWAQAQELATDVGAVKRAEQLAQRLAALAPPTQPRSRPALPAGLSTREVEVLRLVAAGRTNRQIAQELVISEKTVANHLTHIFNKIGVDNRAAAAVFAAQQHLL
ncbi:MAG: hypothetical protein KatS3mg051_2124 [Anaerolineae bacterium]|nr:MAG: hypothetical protein KatS3mg050_4313 [Litorilinea sp.]GIV82770.1 MAG: hypothetical protein KatS3mg051_2124 [Anaerolineae bacterium]